jgi:DNA repair exonuclease SbcCD nuclease subunit
MDEYSDGDDVALKIVHTADWHLGARYLSFDERDRSKLTRARLEAVKQILDVAERNRVDAVLVAGDTFDEPQPDKTWWEGLAAAFGDRQKWPASRPLFLLPGNHDPLTASSVYHDSHYFRSMLPPWVHIVDRDDFVYALSDEAVLYARPCRKQAGQMDLAMALPAREEGDERIRIGMVHGSTFNMPNYQTNFPIAKDAAVVRGFDYLAIGDTHAYQQVPPDAPVPTVYPGTPEQLTWGEHDTGSACVVLFRRKGRKPIIRQERVATWTWRKETIIALETLRELRDLHDLKKTVLHLTLDLRVPPAEYQEVEAIIEELAGTDAMHGRVGVLQVDRDRLALDTSAVETLFEDLPPVIQAAARKLEALQQTEQAEVAARALYHLYRLSRQGG